MFHFRPNQIWKASYWRACRRLLTKVGNSVCILTGSSGSLAFTLTITPPSIVGSKSLTVPGVVRKAMFLSCSRLMRGSILVNERVLIESGGVFIRSGLCLGEKLAQNLSLGERLMYVFF